MASTSVQRTELHRLYAEAARHHGAGRLAEAEALYRRVLAADDSHADSLHALGVIAFQSGHFDTAVALIRRAVAADGAAATYHSSLGVALQHCGLLAEAEASYTRALDLKPDFVEAHCNLGNVLLAEGKRAAAMACYRKALALRPHHALSHYNLGLALDQDDRPAEAAACYRRAIAIDPGYADAHGNLGLVQQRLGKIDEAAASHRRAVDLRPADAEAHYNLGVSLHLQGHVEDAIDHYERAVSLKPGHAKAHHNLGVALAGLGRLDEAEARFRRALALDPMFAEAHSNLGDTLRDRGDMEEALLHLERAVHLNPASHAAHTSLIFGLNFVPGANTADQQARRKAWCRVVAQPVIATAMPPHPPEAGQGRLKVGYVSAHLRHHAAAYAFGSAILHHDRERFDVACYSDTRKGDEVTARLRGTVALWRDTASLSDEQLAAQIRADGIHILVDCVGHMEGNRLLAFARKPAPIQVSGWGEPTGTGLATMDYLLADPVLIPAAERSLFTENVIDLPCALGYWTPEDLPSAGPLPALQSGRVTFGSFARPAKMTDATLALWAGILARLPAACLLLKSKGWTHAAAQESLRHRAEAQGIAPHRVMFLGDSTRAEHFAAYTAVDICLDTLPHGGGMTTLDALWMGVPVIARGGQSPSSRLAPAVLSALDLHRWIAEDDADYVAKAVALAGDVQQLTETRQGLRHHMQRFPVATPQLYARAVEAAYNSMYARWRTGAAMKATGDHHG